MRGEEGEEGAVIAERRQAALLETSSPSPLTLGDLRSRCMSGGLRVCRCSRPRATSNATWAPRFSHLHTPGGRGKRLHPTLTLLSGMHSAQIIHILPSILRLLSLQPPNCTSPPPTAHTPPTLPPPPPRSTPHAARPAPQRTVQVASSTQLRNQADTAGAKAGPVQSHDVGVVDPPQ